MKKYYLEPILLIEESEQLPLISVENTKCIYTGYMKNKI